MLIFNALIGVSAMIAIVIFCTLGCLLGDNEDFYRQQTKVRIARANIVLAVYADVAFCYTVIGSGGSIVPIILSTLFLAGLQCLMMAGLEFPILRQGKT